MQRTFRIELLVAVICLGVFIFSSRALLYTGEGVLPHDNFYWCYPVFHYFAENIAQGRLVLWDPYVHGGEPFYPLMAQLRLWDPLTILSILVTSRFTQNTVIWFNWWHVIQSLVLACGVHLLYRPLIRRPIARIFLVPILIFSSLMITSFSQNGMLLGTLWVPFQAYFALRLIHRRGSSWSNWLLFAVVVGINWQSYFFAATWVFLVFAFVALLIFRRHDLVRLVREENIGRKVSVFFLIVALLALPNVALLSVGKRFVFPARMAAANYASLGAGGGPVTTEGDPSFLSFGIRMPYDFVNYTGGASTPWDYLQMIEPTGNWILYGNNLRTWGAASESYIYFGAAAWFLGLYGMFFGRHARRPAMIFLLGALVLLTLGPRGGLHPLLYPVFPPLWFLRNTSLFTLLVQIAFIYFICLGLNRVFPREAKP